MYEFTCKECGNRWTSSNMVPLCPVCKKRTGVVKPVQHLAKKRAQARYN